MAHILFIQKKVDTHGTVQYNEIFVSSFESHNSSLVLIIRP